MADNGLYGAKDYDIKRLELITSGGQTLDIRNIFFEMQIFQDIYSSVMSGNIFINDGNDVFRNFYLCGNEYLNISIDKPGLNAPFERLFRIYKVTDRRPSSDSGQVYLLHFCSDELISSTTLLVSKSYKTTKIKNIVSDILINELGVSGDRIARLEETSGTFDLIIPGYRPFEAIQWATSRGYDQKKFCYFFFENRDGFNLSSLQTLIKQKPYKELKYELKNVNRDPALNKDSIDTFRIINDFDMITSITNGSFSSRLLSIDIFSQKFENHDYNLIQAEAQGNLLNPFKPVNSFNNSKNQNLFNSPYSLFRTYLSINDTASERSNDVKHWMLPRAMHMSMLNHFRIQIVLPGDILLKAGDVIDYKFPAFESADSSGKKMDEFRSCRYLVASVNHKFNADTYESVVELVADSFAEPIPTAKDNINFLTKKGR